MVDVVACQFWFAGFAMYRSATANVRERFRSQDKMDEISDEIEEMTEKVKKELENVRPHLHACARRCTLCSQLQYSLVDYQKRMRDLKP